MQWGASGSRAHTTGGISERFDVVRWAPRANGGLAGVLRSVHFLNAFPRMCREIGRLLMHNETHSCMKRRGGIN